MSTSTNPPSISIVIPNYNLSEYLERTIQSVAEQEYAGKEIILADGASSDGSMEIVERYRSHFSHVISEPDNGHADALNKGFTVSSGEIMCWINSDDVLLPGCFQSVAEIFSRYPEVEWIVGNSSHISASDHLLGSYRPRHHSRIRFLMGDYRWVQQESTFWRRSLWEKAGSHLCKSTRLAVDFELWLRFFRHASLYGVAVGLGAFRSRPGQRSQTHFEEYLNEVETILKTERKIVDSEFFAQHNSLLQMPFMIRTRAEADAFGEDIRVDDLQPIVFDCETNDWLNPNTVAVIC